MAKRVIKKAMLEVYFMDGLHCPEKVTQQRLHEKGGGPRVSHMYIGCGSWERPISS